MTDTTMEPRKVGGKVAKFDPRKTRLKIAGWKEGARIAARIRDWDSLESAIDAVIEEQRAFTAWWQGSITPGQGPTRGKTVAAEGPFLSVAEATKQTGVTKQQASKWRRRLKDENSYRDALRENAYAPMWAVPGGPARGTAGTGENEWWTPEGYLDLARGMLGKFDLDPASSKGAQRTVRAEKYFTMADDGLTKEWHGKVWLNPPYAQPMISDFVAKMLAEIAAGHVTEAIMLTNNYTDTEWFRSAVHVAAAICFTCGRVRFVDPDGNLASPTQGQAFFYFGADVQKFAQVFRSIGYPMALVALEPTP